MKAITLIMSLFFASATFASATRVLSGDQIKSSDGVYTFSLPATISGTSDSFLTNSSTSTMSNKTLTSPVINTPTGIVKGDVGLGNVDNTSDANKPVSSATSTALSGKIDVTLISAPSGVASLDGAGKVPFDQLPASLMVFKGVWDASTNTPSLADGTGTNGWVYRANVAGSVNFGAGAITFAVGDWAIYNGSIWQLAHAGADVVLSVNGYAGVVSLTKTDLSLGNVDNTSDVTKNAASVSLTNHTIDGALNTLSVLPTQISGPVTIAKGGTGQTTAADAITALLPGYVSGAFLTNDGSNASWATVPATTPNVSGSQASPVAVTAGVGVVFSGSNYGNIHYLAGSAGPVIISANPQIAAGSLVGQSLTLIGTHATNTITMADGTGISLNGPITLGNNSAIVLNWDGGVWTEVSRR